MSFGLGFAFPAYPLRGGGGNNPFNQSGPTLDLTFAGVPTDLSDPNGYSLSTDFIVPQYQIAAQYSIWENDVGLVSKTFSQIITFSRTSGATWFNATGTLIGIDFSSTSETVGTGSKSFTLDATAGVDRYWTAGDTVLISDQANSANNMVGTVTSYNASTQVLVCNITSTGGSGTITSWRIGSTMPRFDYDPATLAARGFLIEESRTNSIRNNTMQGAVAGTPGTLPTNWSVFTSVTGVTREIVGTGTEKGITYIDVKLSGTPSSSGSYQVFPELSSVSPASSGQTWTCSAYFKLQSGGLTGISSTAIVVNERDSVGNLLVGTSTTFTPSSTLTRVSVTRTFTDALTARASSTSPFIGLDGAAIDITLRIGLPQLENNNISTGVASATVASGGSGYAIGDVLQIVGGTGTAARLTVATLSGSAVATVTVSTAGSYSVFPSPQPVSVTAITGTGTSATFNIVPQTQTGFATSVIPTTTTALTRSADVASVNTLSPWYNATEGTLYAEFNCPTAATNQYFASLDLSASTRMSLHNNAGSGFWFVRDGGVTQASVTNGTITSGATVKVAGAYAINSFNLSTNGGIGTGDTSGSVPSGLTRLSLGSYTASALNPLNGYLRRITYYPRRLSNAELQSITA